MFTDTNLPLDFTYCLCYGEYVDPSDKSAPLICRSCEKLSHRHCTCYVGPDHDFECFLCQVQVLDPFNAVVEFLWYGRMGNKHEILKISAPQFDKWLAQNRDVYVVSLPLSKNKLVHEWPKTFELRINNELVHVVKAPNWGHTRRDNPIKVTYAMHTGDNMLELSSTTYDDPVSFFLIVIMVSKRISVERIIETIKKRRTITVFESKRRILEFLNTHFEDDDVICVKNNRVELNCPLTLDRIELPTRGKLCKHIQCFDLSAYLQVMQNMSTFNKRWKCPECPLTVKPMDLVIDGYMLEILKSTPQGASTVELNETGDYRVVNCSSMCKYVKGPAELGKTKNRDCATIQGDSSTFNNDHVSSDSGIGELHTHFGSKRSGTDDVFVKVEGGINVGYIINSDMSDLFSANTSTECTPKELLICLESSDGEEYSKNGAQRRVESQQPTCDKRDENLCDAFSQANSNALGKYASEVASGNKSSRGQLQAYGCPKSTLSQRLSNLPQIAGDAHITKSIKRITTDTYASQSFMPVSPSTGSAVTAKTCEHPALMKRSKQKTALDISALRFGFFR
ncbi:MIZ zinc finger domain containing protein, putative [Babesia bigemina]|uniref:MIZ zinc finger domain containing protein, putative n=1 Tax=Babesia bigemina TaxID=5866 RepID=A0A061DC63_BABBI|nr:MIZ zinc finger domain containing protein, putative [Babesia bigemina]CDR95355.1 MIZ zinc finger domain containing protein, putative [Babesia bigemina]|eukprot:XP_012767541.1 MIZ zinc finger domain containing protein, putative [Babesia bigemina]